MSTPLRRERIGLIISSLCILSGLAPYKIIYIPKSGLFLLVEYEIQGLGIQNSAQGIRNPHVPLTRRIRNPELGIQNPRL